MIDILYNKEGTPLLMQSTSLFVTTESDKESIKERSRALFPYDDDRRDYIYLDDKRVVAWGQDNMFPQLAVDTVRTTTVLNTGLKFLMRLTMGQGIYPCEVTGYDDDGNETLSPIKDEAIKSFVSSRMVRRYMEKCLRDYLKCCSAVRAECRGRTHRHQHAQLPELPIHRARRQRAAGVHRG